MSDFWPFWLLLGFTLGWAAAATWGLHKLSYAHRLIAEAWKNEVWQRVEELRADLLRRPPPATQDGANESWVMDNDYEYAVEQERRRRIDLAQ